MDIIVERDKEIKEIHRKASVLKEVMLDLEILMNDKSTQVKNNITQSNENTSRALKEIKKKESSWCLIC